MGGMGKGVDQSGFSILDELQGYSSIFACAWLEKMCLDWSSNFMISKAESGLTTVHEKQAEASRKDITVKLDLKPRSKPKLVKTRPVSYALRLKVYADLQTLFERFSLSA